MSGLLHHFRISLRIYFRNKMALFYGYLFPLIFLVAFAVLYRHEKVPLARHMGELLTVCALGGACLGFPTIIVSERERGVWRRYRLVPLASGILVASSVAGRYCLIISAGFLQLALALALGMPMPAHPLELFVAFSFVAFALLGLGLVIAMLADTVPAVQALGQCIFLPMLIIGGVAVPLSSLPPWAQHVAAFFPGRYAVEAIQACVNGLGLASVRFSLQSLVLIGAAGCVAGAKMFRWDTQQRLTLRTGKAWVGFALLAWIGVGLTAEFRGRIAIAADAEERAPRVVAATPPAAAPAPGAVPAAPVGPPLPLKTLEPVPVEPAVHPVAPKSWAEVTIDNINALDYRLPPDRGIVTPMAGPGDEPDEETQKQLDDIRAKLPRWKPGQADDIVQRVRNHLYVAAVPDAVQMQIERYVPAIVFERLQETIPRDQLAKILCWIALHPGEGDDSTIDELSELDIPPFSVNVDLARERSYYYAIKFVGRLTGRIRSGERMQTPAPR
ncbi:MAG: ABC transporter permease [Verrucomicrobia bacterium]|nr:ABC transporter permease [Verrucomicrobiota bacterium]